MNELSQEITSKNSTESKEEARNLENERKEFERMLEHLSEASRNYMAGKFKVS